MKLDVDTSDYKEGERISLVTLPPKKQAREYQTRHNLIFILMVFGIPALLFMFYASQNGAEEKWNNSKTKKSAEVVVNHLKQIKDR